VLGCLAVVIAVSTWTVASAADDSGERLYEGYCRRCHGTQGRGTTQGPSLIPFDWSYAEALELIRHPVCNMPPFQRRCSAMRKSRKIVGYLKTIK
jgi:mono/diheme cytochrome c family protein